jgi:hypothetical protein
MLLFAFYPENPESRNNVCGHKNVFFFRAADDKK